MKSLLLYRIFSYFLIVIAAILGILSVFALLMALANPSLLINVFVIVAVVIYSFTSFLFLTNGLDGKLQLKAGMKDLINVNAFVALVFVMMSLFQSIALITNPALINEALKQYSEMQVGKSPVSPQTLKSILSVFVWFMLFYGLILGAHISMTFRLMKANAHLFGDKNPDDIHPTRVD